MKAHYPQAYFHTLPTELLYLIFGFIADDTRSIT